MFCIFKKIYKNIQVHVTYKIFYVKAIYDI